jgi:hypothetical protein
LGVGAQADAASAENAFRGVAGGSGGVLREHQAVADLVDLRGLTFLLGAQAAYFRFQGAHVGLGRGASDGDESQR